MQKVYTCKACQICMKQRKKYGNLPVKEVEATIPWNRVNIDLIGPYKLKTPTMEWESQLS